MNSLVLFPTAQFAGVDATAIGPALLVLATGGLFGMSIRNVFDSIMSDGDAEPSSEESVTDGGGLMAEDDDDFGDLGDLDGDDDGDDPFGDDDDFGDMDDAGADTDELEHRLDELENELGSLESTVSTVRTENEQISGSVEEVEENIRKLLDIYEMVTRGVNPFADDVEGGMGGGGMGGDSSFGLFDDDESDGQDEDVDADVASADAEGFFDEDLDDEADDVFPEEEAAEDAFDDEGSFDDEFDDLDDESADGQSFQELKEDYETEDEAEADEDLVEDDPVEESTEDDSAEEPATAAADRSAAAGAGTDGDKPYLAALPDGFAADLVVFEWLEFLVEQGGYRETARAIDYYETIDWIDEGVAEELQNALRGFDGTDGGSGGLTIDDHTRSLKYISELDGGDSAALSRLVGGGGGRGLQR